MTTRVEIINHGPHKIRVSVYSINDEVGYNEEVLTGSKLEKYIHSGNKIEIKEIQNEKNN